MASPAPRPSVRRSHPTRALTALAACLLLAACSAPPEPSAPGAADGTTAAVARLDGVVEVTATDSGVPGEDLDPDDRWVEVGVRTEVPTAAAFAALGAEVAAVLPDDPHVVARLWQPESADLAALAVTVDGTGDRGAAILGTAVDLAEVDGLVGIELTPETLSATVDVASSLPALAAATVGLRTPVLMLGTADQRVSSSLPPGLLDARLAALVARVVARPGVTSQFLDTQGTDEAWLRIQVEGDDTVEELSRDLTRLPWPADAPAVHVTVASSFREQGGLLGRPEDATGGGPPASGEPSAPSPPEDPGARACAGGDLDVRLGGFDAALGRRFLLLTATNTSGASCAVQGRPEIEFRRASGTPVPDVETGTPSGTPDPARVVVPAGESVHAGLTWRGMSTALDPDVTVALLVTAVPGADAATVPVDGDGLDVLAGAAVEIGAWERSPQGWTTG